jgi:ubiquinone/menaquinone biosynthesis C-methylase UbiE
VIEIGAGDGRLAWPFAPEAARWVALDPDADELNIATQALRDNPAPTVRLLLSDARALCFPADYFDLALFTWSLC